MDKFICGEMSECVTGIGRSPIECVHCIPHEYSGKCDHKSLKCGNCVKVYQSKDVFHFIEWENNEPVQKTLPMNETKDGWVIDGMNGIYGVPRLVSNFKPCDTAEDAIKHAIEREKFELGKLQSTMESQEKRLQKLLDLQIAVSI